MTQRKNYWVDRLGTLGWHFVGGSFGNKSYASGWYDALTGFIPRPAYRLMRGTFYDHADKEVVEESKRCRGVELS